MFNEINAPVGGFFAVVQYVIQKATVGGRENTDYVTQTERNVFHERCSALGGCGDAMSQEEDALWLSVLFRLTPAAPSATPPATMRGAIFLPAVATPRSGALRSREIAGVWRCACACACACVCVGVCMCVCGCASGCTRARAVAEHYHADTRPPLQTEETTQTQDHHGHADTRPPRPRKEKEGVTTTRVEVHTGRTHSVHVVLKMSCSMQQEDEQDHTPADFRLQ
jgi:hypothetical protein